MQNPPLMSKKQPKSDRNVDLPDWADDVTPADEVMKKFYAPTGAFKRGPIAPPDPVPALSHAPNADQRASDQSLQSASAQQDRTESEVATVVVSSSPTLPKVQQPESSAIPAADSAPHPSKQLPSYASLKKVSMPPSDLGLNQASSVKTPEINQPALLSTHQIIPQSSEVNEFPSFEDFARKWKMYLYPGQLAVLRTLYEVTYAVGTNECFTRYNEIAKATKMSRRNCINVMNFLVNRGFVERLEVRNDATGKGIRLRIYLDPLH